MRQVIGQDCTQMLAVYVIAMLGWLTDRGVGLIRGAGEVPDEQRLYENLMPNYESAVRPVRNTSDTLVISFKLTLNQIVDLDERKQVLTTNVFIKQVWVDEHLQWDSNNYNGIRTLRLPASYVWLPDTFVFNNANDGSSGFVQGIHVLLTSNGTVSWPVPLKLQSSCKVDIRYFPFDDQLCVLRFGSWIYSNRWMDFESSSSHVDLESYIDNSEWSLRGIRFEKKDRFHAFSPHSHPDLTFYLHIRRKTFYYVWNIIVPCIMLSVLTLLTFWLPPTSGEKVSLGLSVFLAFSMFMLLIAEEVPATSESVPLIGIYLTTVMTMTSVSVIMAVMVINVYNRSQKALKPPKIMKKLILGWLCKLVCMSHQMECLAQTISLGDAEEAKYHCKIHENNIEGLLRCRSPLPTPSMRRKRQEMIIRKAEQLEQAACLMQATRSQPERTGVNQRGSGRLRRQDSTTKANNLNVISRQQIDNRFLSPFSPAALTSDYSSSDSDEDNNQADIWQRRISFRLPDKSASANHKTTGCTPLLEVPDVARVHDIVPCTPLSNGANLASTSSDVTFDAPLTSRCRKAEALAWRKSVAVEWQTIAAVVDRLLFWLFLLVTLVAYLVILVIIPYMKTSTPLQDPFYNEQVAH